MKRHREDTLRQLGCVIDPMRPCFGLLERMLHACPMADLLDVPSQLAYFALQILLEKIGVDASLVSDA